MIRKEFIQMLRCPIDGSELTLAEQPLLQHVNEAIQRGELRDRHDQQITQILDQGLLAAPSNRLYPVRGGIPTLIPDEAIELSQLLD